MTVVCFLFVCCFLLFFWGFFGCFFSLYGVVLLVLLRECDTCVCVCARIYVCVCVCSHYSNKYSCILYVPQIPCMCLLSMFKTPGGKFPLNGLTVAAICRLTF